MQFIRTNINKTYRNGELNVSNVAVTNVGGGGGSSSLSGNFLPAVNNGDGSYTVDLSKVVFTGNLIGEGEITAYGQGSTGGGSTSTGSVTIYDGLDSVAVDAALSANQGRILREMILEAGTGGSTLLSKLEDVTLTNLADGQILKYDATSKKWVNGDGTKVTWTNIEGKPAALTDANIAKWNENSHTHTNKTTLDKITETDITNWNDTNSKKHSHSNKTILDGITSAKVTNWDGVVTNWNKAFYFDSNGDLKVKVNVIGEKEISAYGAGASGGSGSITIVDALTSTATDAALSANQGRILRELIDSKGEGGVTNWADLEGKPSWIGANKPSYTWAEISGKPSTFAPSSHTHNYASTVKVGSTSYNISGNTISLPAYPTVPSALKNPNALTISLNGTSQGAYDGSAAKSFNITAASVGAAASSHSHSISNVSGLQDALNGKAASSHNHNSSYVSALGTNGNYLTWTKNGTTNNITVPYASNSDKLDGMNHTDFESYKLVTIDTSGLNNNTWYPVTMVIGNSQQTRIRIEGNTNANATWNSRGDKNMALILDYTVNGSQWGWTQVVRTIHAYQEGAGTSSCLRGLGQLTNSSTEYVYVRGGAKYNFYVSRFITPTLRTSSYTASSQSVAPTTSAPAAISRNVAYISDTVAAANKVTNSISFAAGSFGTKSYNGSTAVTVNVPTHTSHLTNNSGFITSSATVAAANKVTNTLTFTGYQSKSFNGSAAVSVAIPNNTNQLTNGAGFITSSASISGNAGSATKLQTARTIWGQSFNGTANISGNMTGVGSISANGINTITRDSYEMINLKRTTNNGAAIGFYNNTSTKIGVLGVSANGWLCFDSKTKTDAVQIDNNGTIIAKGDVTAYSDIRLKTNIKPLNNRGYITPVTYKKDGKDSIGFIAQEVRELYPELVIEDNTEDKYLSVNYAQYVAVLQAQIIDLRKEIDELKNLNRS